MSSLFNRGYLLMTCLIAIAFVHCQSPRHTDVELFEKAEKAYRNGEYTLAIDRYESFLQTYPRSPLADTAKLRLRTIHREVKSIIKRQKLPKPIYHRDERESTPFNLNQRPDASTH